MPALNYLKLNSLLSEASSLLKGDGCIVIEIAKKVLVCISPALRGLSLDSNHSNSYSLDHKVDR